MNWFKKLFEPAPPRPMSEIQAELRALLDKIYAQQFGYSDDMRRYENLLREIYSRGIEPDVKLKITDLPKNK